MEYLDMLKGVLTRVRGCPEGEAEDAMRNACMEFCTDTRVLMTGMTVTVDGTEVFTPQFQTQVLDIFEARIAGEQILVTHANDPCVLELGPDEHAITFVDPSFCELTPPATTLAPVTLELLVATAPGPESTGVNDLLWLRHSEALKSGALARLFAMPGVAWSNPELAVYHEGKFREAIKKAASDNGRNRVQPGRRLRVRPV